MDWRGKTFEVVFTAAFLAFWSCAPPPFSDQNAKPCLEKRRLSQKLIDDYGITRQELLKLQFYLENGFVLHRAEASRSHRVTPDHQLDLEKQTTAHSIRFPDGIPGLPVAVDEPRGLFDFSYHIKIKFEIEPEFSLSFTAPVWRGGFILEKSFLLYEVTYGGHAYRCEDWDQPHFLLVCMQSIQKFAKTDRTAPGVKF